MASLINNSSRETIEEKRSRIMMMINNVTSERDRLQRQVDEYKAMNVSINSAISELTSARSGIAAISAQVSRNYKSKKASAKAKEISGKQSEVSSIIGTLQQALGESNKKISELNVHINNMEAQLNSLYRQML